MVLGIFVFVVFIVKVIMVVNFGFIEDFNLEGIQMGMWLLVEEQVVFIVVCIFCLCKFFQQVLQYFGLMIVNVFIKKIGVIGYGWMNGISGVSNVNGVIRMKSLISSWVQSEEDIFGLNGQNGEVEIWWIIEVCVDLEGGNLVREEIIREKI